MPPDPWAEVLERIDDAAKLTGVDPDIHRLLRRPKRVLEVVGEEIRPQLVTLS